jgi:ribose transport system permease protein
MSMQTTGQPATASTGPVESPARAHAAASSLAARVEDVATRYAALVVLVVLLIVSTVANDGFWAVDNLRNIVTQNAPIAFVAIGLTFVIISGVFDLSVGALLAAGSVVYALLSNEMSLPLAAALTLIIGGAGGAVNGIVVTRLHVNPFIGTIGTGAVFTGLVYILCDSSPVSVNVDGFDTLGLGRVAGLPWPFVIVLALVILGSFVLHRTVFGRYVYATGGNGEAARLAGIPVNLIHFSAFVIVGALAALAGMVTSSQLAVGQPTLGLSTPLDAFAIVVIGGTSVYGGAGALWRTGVGVLILAVLNNLFNAMAWDGSRQSVAKGVVLVAAVALDARRRRGRA